MNNAADSLKNSNRVLENVLPARTPHRDISRRIHPSALELIVGSVAHEYIGDLESSEDRYGAVWCLPSDDDDIREIMADLWGKYLSAMVCDEIAEQIIREGWPAGLERRVYRVRNFTAD
jgi:hypothetical protein